MDLFKMNMLQETSDFSRHLLEELYAKTQMSKPVGPDIKWTLSYQLRSIISE